MMRLVIALIIVATGAGTSLAEGIPPLGIRAGFTSWEGTDQIHMGAHAKLGDLFQNVAFTPGFELGFDSDVTVLTVNGDLAYRFTELAQAPWGPYGGGSLSFNFVDWNGTSATDLGLSLLAGTTYDLDNGNELLGEIRLGLMDSPGFKLTFGYTFF
ncbi:MAG: hypothetical protein GY838_04545 [bacterium]|nr:hypothetical protein [bacterium]